MPQIPRALDWHAAKAEDFAPDVASWMKGGGAVPAGRIPLQIEPGDTPRDVAYWLVKITGSLWLAIPVGFVTVLIMGIALETIIFSRLYKRDHLYQVLLTFGLILIFEELRSILFGDEVHGVSMPAVLDFSIRLTDTLSYPVYRLFITAVCLVIAGIMYLSIQKTRLGMMIRAGSSNREMAASLGVNIPLLFALVFASGTALAAFAGIIAAPISTVFPGMGNQILIVCFVVVVIGGIGSTNGAMIASLAIGLADTLGKVLAPEFSGVAVYLLMAIVLLWRPQGLAHTV